MATRKTAAKRIPPSNNHADIEVFKTEDDVTIRILHNPKLPMLIQRAMSSVPPVKRPTYEVKTFSGRSEIYPLDEKSAEETEGGKARWDFYQQEVDEANTERNLRVLRAIFGLGLDLDLPENSDWLLDLEITGIEIPTTERELKLEFLMTQLSVEDMNKIMEKVMSQFVDEETIAEAQESFQR